MALAWAWGDLPVHPPVPGSAIWVRLWQHVANQIRRGQAKSQTRCGKDFWRDGGHSRDVTLVIPWYHLKWRQGQKKPAAAWGARSSEGKAAECPAVAQTCVGGEGPAGKRKRWQTSLSLVRLWWLCWWVGQMRPAWLVCFVALESSPTHTICATFNRFGCFLPQLSKLPSETNPRVTAVKKNAHLALLTGERKREWGREKERERERALRCFPILLCDVLVGGCRRWRSCGWVLSQTMTLGCAILHTADTQSTRDIGDLLAHTQWPSNHATFACLLRKIAVQGCRPDCAEVRRQERATPILLICIGLHWTSLSWLGCHLLNP